MPDPDAQPDPSEQPTVDSGADDPSDLPTIGSDAGVTVDSSAGQPSAGAMGIAAAPSRAALGLDQPQPEHAPAIPGYHITGRLGEGGMGVVWQAVQLATHRRVALKVMGTAMFGSEPARRRFEREVELAARLEHPGIARVYDSGLTHGAYYYAMQLVPGTTLDLWYREQQPTKRETVALMRDICLAVQHAHQRGVIHRDLKPANIIISTRQDGDTTHASAAPLARTGDSSASVMPPEHTGPQPVLVDFGLARPAIDDGTGVSLTGQIAGTPAYMSPEQAAGKLDELDTRTDVYSLGVILYKLLTGKLPHDMAGALHVVAQRIQNDEVKRPRRVSESGSKLVDKELETLLLKALAKEPDRRYASAAAMAEDIDNYLSGEPLRARPMTAWYVIRRKTRKHYKAAAGAALLLVVGLGALGYAKFRPATYILESDPDGAFILINGKEKSGCILTPCSAHLSHGTHEIRLSNPEGFHDAVRVVRVDWGKVHVLQSTMGTEPIRLAPKIRTYVFQSDPPGATAVLTDADTGAEIARLTTPAIRSMQEGAFRARYELPGYTDPYVNTRMKVVGSSQPVTVERALVADE